MLKKKLCFRSFFCSNIYLALSVFGVSQHVNFHVKLIDWMKTPIRDDIFMDFIEKYNNVPNFFIELVYRVDFENTVKVVTPFVSVSLFVVEKSVHTCVRLLSKIFLRFSVQTHCIHYKSHILNGGKQKFLGSKPHCKGFKTHFYSK